MVWREVICKAAAFLGAMVGEFTGAERGMGVLVGRLRPDPLMDWRFVCLSHNTLRGAAGGGVLSAELLCAKGEIQPKH